MKAVHNFTANHPDIIVDPDGQTWVMMRKCSWYAEYEELEVLKIAENNDPGGSAGSSANRGPDRSGRYSTDRGTGSHHYFSEGGVTDPLTDTELKATIRDWMDNYFPGHRRK